MEKYSTSSGFEIKLIINLDTFLELKLFVLLFTINYNLGQKYLQMKKWFYMYVMQNTISQYYYIITNINAKKYMSFVCEILPNDDHNSF